MHYNFYHQYYSLSLLSPTFLSKSFFATLNFILNIIIISISHNNWMSLYDYFCLVPTKNILRDVLYISYYDNIKTWMKYCACWNYDNILQWLLFPITIGVFCMNQRYCNLTTKSPAEITCPSIVVWNFVFFNTNGLYVIFQSR